MLDSGVVYFIYHLLELVPRDELPFLHFLRVLDQPLDPVRAEGYDRVGYDPDQVSIQFIVPCVVLALV